MRRVYLLDRKIGEAWPSLSIPAEVSAIEPVP